jgi:hypothetical protein
MTGAGRFCPDLGDFERALWRRSPRRSQGAWRARGRGTCPDHDGGQRRWGTGACTVAHAAVAARWCWRPVRSPAEFYALISGALFTPSPGVHGRLPGSLPEDGVEHPRPAQRENPQVKMREVADGESVALVTFAKDLVDGHFSRGGAGGNRTPVHQPTDETATTIPASRLTLPRRRVGWLAPRGLPTPGLCLESAVFPAVSGLFHRHPPLLLPGCGGPAPCGIAAHDDSSPT